MTYRKRNYKYNRNRTYRSRRGRSQKNYTPLITFFVVLLIVLFLFGKLIGLLFGAERTEDAVAKLQVLQGQTEFQFPEGPWTPATEGQVFRQGDRIRTQTNTKASLEFFPGTILFLNGNTEISIETLEERSSGKKDIVLLLNAGEVWGKTSSEDFNKNTSSTFQVKTTRSQVNVRGTIFDFHTTTNQDVLRLIKGNVDVDIFDPENPENKETVVVEVGQKIVINETTRNKIKNKAEVKEIIDSSFIESDWHIENIEQFSPEEAAEIRRRIELQTPQKAPETTNEKASEENQSGTNTPETIPAPEITTPENNTIIPATQDTVTLEGIAPENTMQIVVNGYTLTRFTAGDRKWQYFASTKFGTLQPGENTYEVVAVFRDGSKSAPTKLTLTYEGAPEEENEKEESPVITSTINDYKAPIVTSPVAIPDGGTYETSATSVRIRGLVDPKTNRVLINDYQLKEFRPGNTEFKFDIVNTSNPSTSNMVEGNNQYAIKTFGPDGKQATTNINVLYKPISVSSE